MQTVRTTGFVDRYFVRCIVARALPRNFNTGSRGRQDQVREELAQEHALQSNKMSDHSSMDHFQQVPPDGRAMRMPSDQGVGGNTYVRGVHHAYNDRDPQRQEAFERQWALREGEWQQHASELAAQIYADHGQKDLIQERERQQQGRGQPNHDADDKDRLKIKCPSPGDDDAGKDSKIGSKEYLIWKKAVVFGRRLHDYIPDGLGSIWWPQ